MAVAFAVARKDFGEMEIALDTKRFFAYLGLHLDAFLRPGRTFVMS